MVKLAPMLEEIPEDICVSGHERSGSHDRKLHQAFPLSRGGGIGPESITLKSEMANHNSRVFNSSYSPIARANLAAGKPVGSNQSLYVCVARQRADACDLSCGHALLPQRQSIDVQ